MQKMVIFHADDFNLTQGVNRGILEAHKYGIVMSTSIMINLPGIEESTVQLFDSPALDVGLHINLTYGKPVSEPEQVKSLVDDQGVFWRRPKILMEYAKREDIIREINAQLKLAKKMNLNISHIDSHHHIHQFEPFIHHHIIELAEDLHLAVRSIDEEMRECCRLRNVPTTEGFCGNFYGVENVSPERLEDLIGLMPSAINEVMCHPGYNDEELTEISSYTIERNQEVKVLTSPKIVQLLQKNQVKLSSFADILDFYPGFERKPLY